MKNIRLSPHYLNDPLCEVIPKVIGFMVNMEGIHTYHSSSSLASLIKEFVGLHLNGCAGDGVGVGLEDGVCDLWILFL